MSIDLTKPLKLAPARAWRTYIGGTMLDALHGVPTEGDTNFPEEWIMSVVSARNSGREGIVEGISFIEGTDVTLKELIEQHPEDMLGKAHIHRYGITTGVLVKLIDAGERLTVQVHPTKAAAGELFNSEFGKTECWHILGGRTINGEEPCIYFGFKPGITREYWKKCFDEQDIPSMLGCLHKFPVKTGDTYLIRGGIPHAIGCGCFLTEIQEPTDYTVRTERITPAGLHVSDFMCHQGLGFERMFDCFVYDGQGAEETKASGCLSPKLLRGNEDFREYELVGYGDTSCFMMHRLEIDGKWQTENSRVFCGLYILSGHGTLRCDDAEYSISAGDQFFIPAVCGSVSITAEPGQTLTALRNFGPNSCSI